MLRDDILTEEVESVHDQKFVTIICYLFDILCILHVHDVCAKKVK